MTQLFERMLYASRLTARVEQSGRWHLSSLLRPGAVPLYGFVEAVFATLWDRNDRRSIAERLDGAGAPAEPMRTAVVEQLYRAGLLVEAELDEAEAWLDEVRRRAVTLPSIDEVELSNACPFTCPFCPRGLGQMTRPVGHMDLGLLRDLVAQVRGQPAYKSFGLHHFGDPLLHPKVEQAVRIVAEAGLEPEISVNPILLTEARARGLLEAGVRVLIVSLDGLDTDTLRAMRGAAAGEITEVLARIERLIGWAGQRREPPNLIVSMVGTRLNQHQWPELFARFERPQVPWLKPVVRALNDFGQDPIHPLSVVPLRQLCGSPYQLVSVLWDGRVVPCCQDFDGQVVVGDLRRQSLAEIWQGEPLRQFRQRWEQFAFNENEPCARCAWHPRRFVDFPHVAETDAWSAALWRPPFPPLAPEVSKSREPPPGRADALPG